MVVLRAELLRKLCYKHMIGNTVRNMRRMIDRWGVPYESIRIFKSRINAVWNAATGSTRYVRESQTSRSVKAANETAILQLMMITGQR
jgi:hypothetical protein